MKKAYFLNERDHQTLLVKKKHENKFKGTLSIGIELPFQAE